MRRELTMLAWLALLLLAAVAILGFLTWARTHVLPVVVSGFAIFVLIAVLAFAIRRARLRRFAATQSLALTDAMTGPQFESWCANLLRLRGLLFVSIQGGAGDRGVDIRARDRGGRLLVVQCKRQVKKIGSPVMQQFVGSALIAKADVALFMTNSYFTNEAHAIGRRQGIVMADRIALGRWLLENLPPAGIDGTAVEASLS